MTDPIDIKQAFEALAEQNAELTFAFYGFASLVSGSLTGGEPFSHRELADELEHLAEQAGEHLAIATGQSSGPNSHLQFLAATMRDIGQPVVLTSIDGGKNDPPSSSAEPLVHN